MITAVLPRASFYAEGGKARSSREWAYLKWAERVRALALTLEHNAVLELHGGPT